MSTPRRTLAALLFAAAALIASGHAALAQTAQPIDRVEEDWELVIEEPDVDGAGPQVTTTMSPQEDNSASFFAFNVNYRDSPFRAGGLQVLAWSGKDLLASTTDKEAQCSTSGETITWTQRLSLSGGSLAYQIAQGRSTTWGSFNQGGQLDVSPSTSLASLDSYSPAVSVANSGVGWQANHVTRMTLARVRYYSGGTLVRTDDTPRSISLGG
jgi:hypothetical protein